MKRDDKNNKTNDKSSNKTKKQDPGNWKKEKGRNNWKIGQFVGQNREETGYKLDKRTKETPPKFVRFTLADKHC